MELGLSVDHLVTALPACVLSPGDGALDLDRGCVDGVCADTPVAEALEVLEPTCNEPTLGSDGDLHCDTDDDISFFDARKDRNHPRKSVHAFYLGDDYAGRTAKGLGIGVSLGCFLQELGTPDKVEIEREESRFVITELRFGEPKVWVQAEDGVVDRLVIYGPKGR